MGYRVSTAVFALLFAFMVVKDLTRPEPESEPADGRGRVAAGAGAKTLVTPAETPGDSVPEEIDPPSVAQDEPAREETDPPSREEDPPDAPVDARELAIRLLPFDRRTSHPSSWREAMALLGPRKNEVVPVLKDWIRRREELERSGIDMRNIFVAYAKLAGPRAVPILESILDGGTGQFHHAALALCSIDDSRAVEIVRDYQVLRPRWAWEVDATDMWWGAPAFKDLIRGWMTAPPANHADLMKPARNTVFRYGTAEDRQAVWALLDRRERLRILHRSQAEGWVGHDRPERFLGDVTRGLSDPDPWVRYLAADCVLDLTRHLDPAVVDEAERVMVRDLESVPRSHRGGRWAPGFHMARSLRDELLEVLRARESLRKMRELLAPR